MADADIEISKANEGDIPALYRLVEAAGSSGKPAGFFERCVEEQKDGVRDVLLALRGGEPVGFVMLNGRPQYALYKRLEIPEIQDLNVVPEMRRRGIATALIHRCENMAREKGCAHIGIAVGVDSGYGAAQRLYVKLGYIPDGHGITYDREPVRRGEFRAVDDDLCLMMVKAF